MFDNPFKAAPRSGFASLFLKRRQGRMVFECSRCRCIYKTHLIDNLPAKCAACGAEFNFDMTY
jgi:PHP family Zn ribbon phosphoesterase